MSTTSSLTRRVALSTLALAMLLQTTACSFFASGQQSISVTSHPSGALVTINGNHVGATPLQYSINRSKSAAVMVTKDGYHPGTRVTSRRLSTTGILDVIGGVLFLIPLLGLISDGAWEQEPENISVTLVEDD